MDPTKSLSISTEENYTMLPQAPARIANVSENINSESAQVPQAQENNESNTQESSTENKEAEEQELATNNSPTTHHDFHGWGFPNTLNPYMQFFPNPLCYPFQFPPYNANGFSNSNNANVTAHEHSQPNPSAMQVPRSDEKTHSRSVSNNQQHTPCPFPPPYPNNSMYYQPLPVIFCAGHHLNNPYSQDFKSNCSPESVSNFKIPQEITSFIDDLGRNWTCLDTDSCKGNKEKGKILTRKTAKIPSTTARKATTKSESRRIVTPSEESPRNIKEDGSSRRQFHAKSRKSSPNDLGTKKRPSSKSKKLSRKPIESDSADSCAAEYGSLMSLPKSRNRTKESKNVPVSSTSDGKFENRTRSLSWGSELDLLAKNNVKRLQSELITSRNNYNDVSDEDVDENQPDSNPSLTKAYYRPNWTRIIKNSLNRLGVKSGTHTYPNRCPAENLHPRTNNAPEPTARTSKKKGNAKNSRQSSRTQELFNEETDNDSTSSSSDSNFNVLERRKNTKSKRKDDSNKQRRSDNSDWDQPKPHSILKNLKKIQSAGLIPIANRSRSPRSGNESKKSIKDEPRTQKPRTSWGSDVSTEETNRFRSCQNSPTYQGSQWTMNDSPDPMTAQHHHADIAPRQSTSHSPIQSTSNALDVEDYHDLNNNTLLNTLNNANLFHRTAFNGRMSNADRPLEENRYRNNILRRSSFNVENLADFRVPNDRLGHLESQLFRFSGRGSDVNNFENNLQVSINGGARRVRLCPTPRNQNNFDLLTPHLELNHDTDRRLDENSRTLRSIRRPSMMRPRTPRNGGHTSGEETARQNNWMELERVTYRRPRSANTVRKNPVTKRNPKLEEEFNRIQNSDYMMKLNENLVKEDDSRENTEVGEHREFRENDENNRCDCDEEQEEQSKNQQPEQDYEDDF